MTLPPQTDHTSVAVELERLRGSVDTGFATVNGKLEGVLQRTATVETNVVAVEQRIGADITALEQRVAALEKGRWPLPSLAAVVGVAALLVSLYSAVAH